MKRLPLLVLFIALPVALPFVMALPATAQDIVPDQPAQQPATTAATTTAAEPPPPALPVACEAILARPFDGGLDPRITPDCDATAWYFGIGRDKDLGMARACAYIERFKGVDKDGSLFTGPGILSMVYANGEGTPRDLDLARRFTCENKEATPAEVQKRLDVIDKIAAAPDKAPHFDLCSTSSSGISWGWCTNVQLRLHDAKRYAVLTDMVDKLTPEGQKAFIKLQTVEEAFEILRAQKEVDQTGTARWAWMQQEQDRVRAEFVSDFKLFADPDFKQPATFTVVDGLVNRDLDKIRQNAAMLFRDTTITLDGVEETQRAWLKYRDAWRDYEAVINPKVSGDDVETQISRERLYHLHKLATP